MKRLFYETAQLIAQDFHPGCSNGSGLPAPFRIQNTEIQNRRHKIDHEVTSVYFLTAVIVQWPCVFEGEKYFQKRIAHKGAEARPYWAPRIGNPGDQIAGNDESRRVSLRAKEPGVMICRVYHGAKQSPDQRGRLLCSNNSSITMSALPATPAMTTRIF